MADERATYASEQEIAQLRDEVRRLREEQERQKQQHPDGQGQPEQKEEKKGEAGGDKDQGDKHQKDEDRKKQDEEKKPHPLRKVIIIAVVILIAAVGVVWWLHSRHFEDTDDATVDAHISGIAARVAGRVVGVYVEENQFVKAGQVIVDLDPRDFQTALLQAQGQLQQALSQTLAEQPNVPVTEVTNQTNIATTSSSVDSAQAGVAAAEQNYEAAVDRVHESEANNVKAQADVERYRPLTEKDEVPREQFDQVVATAKAMAATVAANQASAQAALKQIDVSRQQLVQAERRAQEAEQNAPRQIAIRQATIRSRQGSAEMARAQVEQARLNLSYCKITSPVNGIIAKRIAEVGADVTPGQQLVLVTQTDDLWVTANFRETQLRRMHPGQDVRIHVDALGADFDGYLEGMPAASGAVTSLLPPENATGNFVKIVQRLPVRIRFKKDQNGLDRLRPGMSVEPKIRVE